MVIEYADNNFLSVANALGWLGVQVIAAVALTAPPWVVRGRGQVTRWWAAAIGVGAAGVGLAVSTDRVRPVSFFFYWLSTGIVVVAFAGSPNYSGRRSATATPPRVSCGSRRQPRGRRRPDASERRSAGPLGRQALPERRSLPSPG